MHLWAGIEPERDREREHTSLKRQTNVREENRKFDKILFINVNIMQNAKW